MKWLFSLTWSPSVTPGFGHQFNLWLEVRCLLCCLQLVAFFLVCFLESKLQEPILAVCEGLLFSMLGWESSAQASAAEGPGESCRAECSHTGQVLFLSFSQRSQLG